MFQKMRIMYRISTFPYHVSCFTLTVTNHRLSRTVLKSCLFLSLPQNCPSLYCIAEVRCNG